MNNTIKILVSGKIQGVGFRYSTKKLADYFNINGYVQNLINGQVKIIAQGENNNIQSFINNIKNSPTPYGKVTDINITSISVININGFFIK